jgi:hypothetical protein
MLRATYECVSKSFRTGCLEREMQMARLSATRCNCITIFWVSLVSFAVITLCVASQRVFIVISVYFVITQSGNFWIHSHSVECCYDSEWWIEEDVGGLDLDLSQHLEEELWETTSLQSKDSKPGPSEYEAKMLPPTSRCWFASFALGTVCTVKYKSWI